MTEEPLVDLSHYQRVAWRYDQHPASPEKGLVIALLGLGGEVGTLQTTQKKVVRDNDGHLDSRTSAVEDLGDILWYVADAATWLGIDLDEVADGNLTKIARRWDAHDLPFPQPANRSPVRPMPVTQVSSTSRLGPAHVFDGAYGPSERLPAVTCDLDARTIDARPLTGEELDAHAVTAADFLAKQAAMRR
jgi:NTP pyrophosphatase (non-canonical NTP hydrolase)